MNRRVWSAEETTAIVVDMIMGGESTAAICTSHGGERISGLSLAGAIRG